MNKSLSAAVVLGIAAALVFATGSSAQAAPPATLPSGQSLYAIDCGDFAPQLWSVAPTGAAVPVGNASATATGSDCAGGGQTNPVDGLSYFIFYPNSGNDAIAKVDLTTGVVTIIADISGDTSDAWQLFITNSGAAFVTQGTVLYSIDLATGVTAAIGSIAPVTPGAVGYDSLTDTIYAFSFGNTMAVYTIDRTTGAATNTGLGGNWPVASCLGSGTGSGAPDGVAFDSAGFAWIQSDSCDSNIMTVDMSNGSSSMVGELFDSTAALYPAAPNDFYSETFIIGNAVVTPPPAPTPGLAATGFDSGAIALGGGIAAAVALLGAALIARTRRTA